MKAISGTVCLFFSMIVFPASAAEPYTIGNKSHRFISPGLTLGALFNGEVTGGYVGLEGNYAVVNKGSWKGVYTDVIYDFTQATTTIGIGPKIGVLIFGVDGGLGVRLDPKLKATLGLQLRPMITFGVFSLYCRLGGWPSEEGLQVDRLVGISLKFPMVQDFESRSLAP